MVECKPAWGYHLIVDAGECADTINDPDYVKSFLRKLVNLLQMEPLGPPTVIYVDTPEGKGVTGVQIITTSTITFHGDDAGKRVFIDVFSCREYNPDAVLAFIQEWFEPKTIKHIWILRDAPESVYPQLSSSPNELSPYCR